MRYMKRKNMEKEQKDKKEGKMHDVAIFSQQTQVLLRMTLRRMKRLKKKKLKLNSFLGQAMWLKRRQKVILATTVLFNLERIWEDELEEEESDDDSDDQDDINGVMMERILLFCSGACSCHNQDEG